MESTDEIFAYYYPTTAIFIDDSQRFLTTISLKLDTRLAYLSFTRTQNALNYLTENSSTEDLASKCLSENFNSDSHGLYSSEYDVKITLSNLYSQIYNSNRFNEISVAIVDYSMPSMNGAEFCTILKTLNKSVKIILLTVEADENKGIELFNKGLIDKFVLKNSPNFSVYVNSYIVELQKTYFEDQSSLIIKNISEKPLSWIKSQTFIKLFNQIRKEYDIVEYYLLEKSGSFFMLKFDGKPLWFIVCDDTDIEEYYDIAKDCNASEAVLKLLKDRRKIPYFDNPDERTNVEGIQWEAYLHSAKKITINNKDYYYTLVEKPNLFDIKEDIVSYKYYLENLWPPI